MTRLPRLALGVLVTAAPAPWLAAQVSHITEPQVRGVVSWLAADELRGRDTGSVEIARAGEWLAARFAAAGLKQVTEGTWFHDFAMAGWRVDSDAVELTLSVGDGEGRQTAALRAGDDVRQWRVSDALSGDEEITVVRAGDLAARQLLGSPSARRPILLEVPDDHPDWIAAAGQHEVLAPRRRAARPVFLVREGALPQIEGDWRSANVTAVWRVGAPVAVDIAQRNVMAMIPAREGSDRADEYVVVSAHYDHVGVGAPVRGDTIYNGADDDASGTTAVVLIAEAMAKAAAPRRNVLFVCFAAEEKGLRGSQAFCDKPPVPIERIVCDLNIEMIGRPEEGRQGKAWITGVEYSDFAAIADVALGKADVGLVDFRMASRLFAQSDNWSFVGKGVVAHSVSAGSLHADYHQPSDEVEKLDLTHMTKIVRGLYELTVDLADRDAAPKWNEAGEQMLKRRGGR